MKTKQKPFEHSPQRVSEDPTLQTSLELLCTSTWSVLMFPKNINVHSEFVILTTDICWIYHHTQSSAQLRLRTLWIQSKTSKLDEVRFWYKVLPIVAFSYQRTIYIQINLLLMKSSHLSYREQPYRGSSKVL